VELFNASLNSRRWFMLYLIYISYLVFICVDAGVRNLASRKRRRKGSQCMRV
jgi:hypothetical protein